MLEDWIDQVCKVWGTMTNGQGGSLISYHVFDKGQIPSALTDYPCAVTYVPEMEPVYKAGAIASLLWSGTTEIHVTKTVDPSLIPDVMKYYTRVLQAATVNRTLSGKVQEFLLTPTTKAIHLAALQYGQAPQHYALIVDWSVLENVVLPLSG